MVEQLAARHALSRDLVEGVTERTGGVPLFVEEANIQEPGRARRQAQAEEDWDGRRRRR
jgi:hypothetical protein